MKLFEIAGTRFTDDLANILRVMQGRADNQNSSSVVAWPAINQLMRSLGYTDVSKDLILKIRSELDPSDELIQDIDDQGISLKTEQSSDDVDSLEIK